MGYTRTYFKRAFTSRFVVVPIAAVSVWQFCLFATFKDAKGIFDLQGGTIHLWWPISAALVACAVGYFVFSLLLPAERTSQIRITY